MSHKDAMFQAAAVAIACIGIGTVGVAVISRCDVPRPKTDNSMSAVENPPDRPNWIFDEPEIDPNEWRTWPVENGWVQADDNCATDMCLAMRQAIIDQMRKGM